MQKNIEYNRRIQEDVQKQSKQIEQRNAAIARLQQYEREQGLLNTQVNQEIINKFLVEAPELAEWRRKGSILSPEIIDAAIKWLRPKLQWKQAEPPKPAAPEKVPLADGTEQLPLGIAPSYKHSKVQLADLASREAQAKSRNRHGWHGAKF